MQPPTKPPAHHMTAGRIEFVVIVEMVTIQALGERPSGIVSKEAAAVTMQALEGTSLG